MAGGGSRTRIAERASHTGYLDIQVDTEAAIKGIDEWLQQGGAWDMRKWEKVSSLTSANAKYHLTNVTSTWEHKPDFDVKIRSGITITNESTKGDVAIDINADPVEPFVFVDKGTRPHMIFPKGPWMLRFQWGGPGSYKAKTTPGSLQARAGGSSGPTVFRRGVHHPGSQPRHIIAQVIAKIGEAWPKIVEQVFGR